MTSPSKVTTVKPSPASNRNRAMRWTRPDFLALAATVALLVLGLMPSAGAGSGRSALRSLHALEGNQADRDKHAGGYYVGLIDGASSSGRDELALRLLGKPADWVSFDELDVVRYLDHDLLRFELKPNIDRPVFGSRFTTDSLGLRDREYSAIQASRHLPHRPAGLVHGHGLGRGHRGNV